MGNQSRIQKLFHWFRTGSLRRKTIFLTGVFIGVPLLCMILVFLMVRYEVIDELPGHQELRTIENAQASELYAEDGRLIGRYFIENRSVLRHADLNEFYKNALIATEDVRFYQHGGIDTRSLFRVLIKTILMQRTSSGGGSTITQQLVKNVYPRKEYLVGSLLINKFREMCIARDMERIYSKDEILLMYSNTVSFGERAFGLRTAAQRFFNKRPSELLLEEAATLVGILKAPTYYSPRRFPERARERRNVVLAQMAKYDSITDEVAAELSELPLRLDYQEPTLAENLAQYFKEYVRKEFDRWSATVAKPDGSKYNIYRDGLRIYTTIDLDLQDAAEREMRSHMQRLQKIFLESWQGGRLFGPGTRLIDEYIVKDPLYVELKRNGLTKKQLLERYTRSDQKQFWSWNGMMDKNTTKIDSIKHYLSLLHAGILAVDPGTGEIKAWVGGNDYRKFQWDNVTAGRHVGSLFKPIVYLTALTNEVDPCKQYKNELITYADYDDWTPENADDTYGGEMALQTALTHSINTVSVQVLFEAGLQDVVKTAEKMGISSPLAKVPSLVLGTSDISLYEMVQAYSVFANEGVRVPLRAITRIENSSGHILYEYEGEDRLERVAGEEYVRILNGILSRVTSEGTASRLYQRYDIPFTVMGKTGTTQNQSDGLFIGYTDHLLIGAWVGAMDRRIHFPNLGTGSGGRTALPMVGALFEYAARRGYRPDKVIHNELPMCPDEYQSEDEVLAKLHAIDASIDSLRKVRRERIREARRDRNNISKRSRRAWEEADQELDDVRDRYDRLIDSTKSDYKEWLDLLKEIRRNERDPI